MGYSILHAKLIIRKTASRTLPRYPLFAKNAEMMVLVFVEKLPVWL
jgi:hypothetical protein